MEKQMGKMLKDIDFEKVYLAHFPKMKRFAREYVVSEADVCGGGITDTAERATTCNRI